MRLDKTASQLPGVPNSLMAAHERLEQQCGHSAASHLPFESLLLSSVSRFVNGVTRLETDKVAACETYRCSFLSIGQLAVGVAIQSRVILHK